MKKISVCGKGGCGKSVTAALVSMALAERGYRLLVIDSDESNPGLYRLFGFSDSARPLVEEFRGGAHIMREFELPEISLDDIPEEYLVQRDGIKLMVAGKINVAFEGCACTLGAIVKDLLRKLTLKEDEMVLVDTEAGVEHFGRGLEKNIDTVLVLVEPSFESMSVAEKISGLAAGIGGCQVWAILNKVSSPQDEVMLKEQLAKRNIRVIGTVHHDSQVASTCFQGKALGESRARDEVRQIVELLLEGS